MQDSRGDQVQYGLLAVDNQGVTGIVPALETDHGMDLLGEQVDHLALALVTPLGPDNDNVLTHIRALYSDASRPIADHAVGAGTILLRECLSEK
jgi:hypothetical protein